MRGQGCQGGTGCLLFCLMILHTLPGTPKPQVTWRRGPSSEPLNGRAGVSLLDEGSLFLSSVSLADSGEYECQATNEAGSASRRAKLVVYGKLRPCSRRPGMDLYPPPTRRPQMMPGPQGPRASFTGDYGCLIPTSITQPVFLHRSHLLSRIPEAGDLWHFPLGDLPGVTPALPALPLD